MTPAADLALIVEAARAAGELATGWRRQGLEVSYKTGGSPLTNADLAADRLLKAMLGAARPDYGWLSEETADDPARLARRRLFVVDPIDGTRAFAKNRPYWSVSIAVVEDERPIAGVVSPPEVGGPTAGSPATRTASRSAQPARLDDCRMAGDPSSSAIVAQPGPAMRIEHRNPPPTAWPVAAGDSDVGGAGAQERLGRGRRRPHRPRGRLLCGRSQRPRSITGPPESPQLTVPPGASTSSGSAHGAPSYVI